MWKPRSTNTKPIAGRMASVSIILKMKRTMDYFTWMLAKVRAIWTSEKISMKASEARNR